MPYLKCWFRPDALAMGTEVDIIMPSSGDKPYKTLYLLHGLSDDNTAWTRNTSIERYVDGKGLAVIMPNVNRSFYANMKCGLRYWDYVSGELITTMREMLPLSHKREDNFVAGLSMGGYGAFKMALSMPEAFCKGASFSGAMDIFEWIKHREDDAERKWMFGSAEEFENSPNDIIHLLKQASESDVKPELYQCCGTEDFLYESNVKYMKLARELNYPLIYEEGLGDHNWEYWDSAIQKALAWMGI